MPRPATVMTEPGESGGFSHEAKTCFMRHKTHISVSSWNTSLRTHRFFSSVAQATSTDILPKANYYYLYNKLRLADQGLQSETSTGQQACMMADSPGNMRRRRRRSQPSVSWASFLTPSLQSTSPVYRKLLNGSFLSLPPLNGRLFHN